MSTLTVYSRPECHLCQEAIAVLGPLSEELDFELLVCDIDTDERLQRAYFERIPVGVLEGQELFCYFVDERILRRRLGSGDQSEPKDEHPLESSR